MLELPEGSWWDWELLRFDGASLTIGAGHDLTYHWGLEVTFTDVAYLAFPTSFQDPVFREPTVAERALVRRHTDEEPAVIVAFDLEAAPGEEPPSGLVAADSVEVFHGVFRRNTHGQP